MNAQTWLEGRKIFLIVEDDNKKGIIKEVRDKILFIEVEGHSVLQRAVREIGRSIFFTKRDVELHKIAN